MMGTKHRVLAIGDEFVRSELFAEALRERVGHDVTVRELELGWPTTPWGAVGGVSEAVGDEQTVIDALLDGGTARALVTHLAPVTARVFAATPELELVAVCRGGPVNVDLEAATEAGVIVTYAPGRNARAAAEFTVGLMLAATRNLVAGHVDLTGTGAWPGHYFRYDNAGFELHSARVGLVGYGAIGHLVAGILSAFGATVAAYDPYADPAAVHPGVRLVDDLDDLLADSMVVSLHARQTEETRGLIGRAQLAAMPTDSVLVNTARGGLLDYDALCDALDSGHLSAAALDVYPIEPLPPDSRLLRTPRLILAPHIAGCSRDVAERAARICAGEVIRWIDGMPPEHCANPDVLAHAYPQRRARL